MRRHIILGLGLATLTLAVGAAVVDTAGLATISYTAPTHAALDAAVGIGYLRASCTADLVGAGACPVADGSPLPTVTATAAMVSAGRVRPELQGQTIPALPSAAAFLDHRMRQVITGYRDRGREELQRRSITPVDVTDPLEVE